MNKYQDRIFSQPASSYAADFVAPLGQFNMELDTGKGKYGDGATPWSSLSYKIGNTSAAGAVSWGNVTGTLSNQTDLQTALDAKAALSILATVATTGAYGDLTGKPTLGTAASTAAANYASSTHAHDATQVTSGVFATARLSSTGTANATAFLSGSTTWVQYSGVATSGAYASLSGKPTLGTSASTDVANFASSTHQHDATQITSGVFDTARLGTGTQNTSTFLSGGTTWAVPSLSYASSFAGATIALGTNTYSTVASVSLGAGTWQVWGQALCGRDVASTTIFTTRISDGTNFFGSGQAQIAAVVSTYTLISIDTLITLGATSTISYDAAATVSSCFVRSRAWQNNAGSTATFIMATRIK